MSLTEETYETLSTQYNIPMWKLMKMKELGDMLTDKKITRDEYFSKCAELDEKDDEAEG